MGPALDRQPLRADRDTGEARFFRLPLRLADFDRRGFRLDRPKRRELLEGHAKQFLTGFNIAARHWRDPHDRLGALPAEERGFAYEGAAMHAALRDIATAGQTRALARLLDGPGRAYPHLIHVGYGWALVPTRLPLPVPMPRTPLLRWLALDGAGFAETYFGGVAALYKRCARVPSDRWRARVAGCGRALWFVECADPAGTARVIAKAAVDAQVELWSGVGLAACYAGGAGDEELVELAVLCGSARPAFEQGAMFAIAARHRSGTVPPHTESACRTLFAVQPQQVARWTDDAAAGLSGQPAVSAYSEWKRRLRERTAHLG